MNDQIFINSYIKVLNDTIVEAMNKNLIMQAQLEVGKLTAARVVELENKLRQLDELSTENHNLRNQLISLNSELQVAGDQVSRKNTHIDTFKRELIESRGLIKRLTKEVELLQEQNLTLTSQLEDHSSKKRKKKVNGETSSVAEEEHVTISVNDTF
jgi:chromosome segregation ATPase